MSSWMAHVPGNLPERYFHVTCEGVDLREATRAFDFAPFREVDRDNSPRSDLDFDAKRWFINPTRFENFRVGSNCYTFFSITVGVDDIELADNYGTRSGSLHDASMALLRHLVVERALACRWWAYSHYSDSGESSEVARGDFATWF